METITFSDSLKINPGGSISFSGDARATLIIDDETIVLSASSSLEEYCKKHPEAPECKEYDV